jgi:hypothetical protein
MIMKKLSLTALAIVAAGAGLAAGGKTKPPIIVPVPKISTSHVATNSLCQRTWYRAADGAALLRYDKAERYIANLKSADPDQDGVFTKAEFVNACKRGLVRPL